MRSHITRYVCIYGCPSFSLQKYSYTLLLPLLQHRPVSHEAVQPARERLVRRPSKQVRTVAVNVFAAIESVREAIHTPFVSMFPLLGYQKYVQPELAIRQLSDRRALRTAPFSKVSGLDEAVRSGDG